MLGARHSEIKHLRRLLGRRSARYDAQQFVVEGPKAVQEAMSANADLVTIYGEAASLAELSGTGPFDVVEVEEGVLASVLSTTTPQPICAIARMGGREPADVLELGAAAGTPVLVCSDVSDPGNVGTLVRAAHASGCAGVVLADSSADIYGPKTVRSTAGSIFHLPVAVGGTTLELLAAASGSAHGSWATVVESEDAVEYSDAELSGSPLIIIGNEANGLPADVAAAADHRLTISMSSGAESLNAAMAGSVVCFEARRQRAERQRDAGNSSVQ